MMMIETPLLTYYNIGGGAVAFSTTRHGGCSKGNYAGFNINPYCGDDPRHVAENRKELAQQLGLDVERIVMPHQTHSDISRYVDSAVLGKPEEERTRFLDGVDAVMTDEPGLCVGVSTADCIPVLLYDSEHRAVCAVHAGWRGTVARIVQKTVMEMQKRFMTEPQTLSAVIGPGISRDSFEVGDEVYEVFGNAGFDMTEISTRKDKWHIDLPKCNLLQLVNAGVDPANVTSSPVCTYNHAEDYFSARRLGVNSGRIYSGIFIV